MHITQVKESKINLPTEQTKQNGNNVTIDTNNSCYISIEKKENYHEAPMLTTIKKYFTFEPFESKVVRFLDVVSVATKKQVIDLPYNSKHNGKPRVDYIKEDQFLTTSKKEGTMDYQMRGEVERGETNRIDNTCTHGTNLYSLLIAVKISDGYMLPLNKQIKRFGLAQSGENKGNTPLNKKYVSSVGLEFYKSCFEDVIVYAKLASNSVCCSSRKLFASQILNNDCSRSISKIYKTLSVIPVVVIGYGISRGYVTSDIREEHVYKRIKVKTIAVPSEKIKKDLESLLPKINPNRSFKVVLIADLERIDTENPRYKRNSNKDKPDYINLRIIDPED